MDARFLKASIAPQTDVAHSGRELSQPAAAIARDFGSMPFEGVVPFTATFTPVGCEKPVGFDEFQAIFAAMAALLRFIRQFRMDWVILVRFRLRLGKQTVWEKSARQDCGGADASMYEEAAATLGATVADMC